MYSLKNIDARIKLFMLLSISTVSIISRDFAVLVPLLVFTVLLLLFGGVGLIASLARLRAMLGLIISIFVLQCLFNRSGDALLSINGFMLISLNGLYMSGAVTLRLFIILFSALIVASGDTRDYLLALNWIRLPYEISFMTLIALRFVPLVRDEAQDIFYAVQMRGTKLRNTSLRHKASVYISMMIPIAAGAISRSEQMSIAMEARAFRAFPKRSSMRSLQFQRHDFIMLVCFIVVLSFIILLGFF